MSFQIGNLDIGVAFAGDVSNLQQATGAAGAAIDGFGTKATKSLKDVSAEAKAADDSMSRLANGIKGAFVGGSIAVGLIKLKNTIIETSDALIQAQVQLDKWNNGFKFGAGSAAGGARELAFVRDEASRLGLELGGAATQYMKMVAAARGSNMEGEKTRVLFTSIAEAATVMGMSGEQSERAMMAVVQMMSKGKVQAEELRGQLGEHLPGAFSIAARAMGVTEVELNKLMETGQVMSADFLPKFAAQLRNELGGSVEDATKSMQASLNRFETAWLSFKQNVSESGVSDAIGGQINILSDAFNGISERMEAARKAGGGFWSQTAAGAGGVAQFLNPINALSYSAISLQGQLEQAKTKLNELEKERPYSGNIFLGPAIEETRQLIAELERAKSARDQLARQPGTGASEVRYSAMVDDAALASQREKAKAYAEFWEKNAGPQAQFAAAVIAAKKAMGEFFTPETEANIRERLIKPTRDAKKEVDDFTKSAIRGQKLFGDLTATDGGLAGDFAEKWGDLSAAYAKTYINAEQLLAAQAALLKLQPFYKKGLDDEKEALKEQAKATAEATKAYDTYFDAVQKNTATLLDNIQSESQSATAIGLTKIAVSELEAAKLQDMAASKERAALTWESIDLSGQMSENLRAEAKALRDLGAVKINRAVIETIHDDAKQAADAWKKASEDIEKSLTDALMRGFESGKGFAEVLRDTVVNMFKTLVLRPVVSAIVSPVAGAITGALGLSGAANAETGGGSLLGTAGTLSSAYNAINGGITNSITAGFNNLASSRVGQSLGLSVEAAGPSLPGMTAPTQLTSFGQTASSWATTIGGTMAGIALGSMAKSLISGGYSAGKGMDTSQNIGVAVGSAIGGPLVGAIIGAGAGVFNRAFGRKLKDQGIQGEFGGEAGFTGENYQFLKGGWFRSDKTKTSPLDADMQSGLANQFKAIQLQTALMATALGDTGQSVADFTSSIKVSFNGLTEAQIGEKLTETFAGIANDLAQTVLGDSAFAKEGEVASQTLQRLSTSLTTVNATWDALGFTLEAVSLAGGGAASSFIDLMGGLENFTAATAGYYANFYTEAERQAKATEQLTAQLAGLGQTLPATRDGFRALVEAAEKAGDNALLAGLLNLQDEFAALTPAAEKAATAVSSVLTGLQSTTKSLQREIIELQGGDLRAFDTEGMTVSERAAYDLNASLTTLRDSLKASQTAATETAATQQQAAADTLSAWKSAQQSMAQGWLEGAQKLENVRYESAQRELDAARQAASAIATARTSAAQASIEAVRGIAGALTNAREALTGAASQPLTTTSYRTARGLIDQAAATGNLNQSGLEDALKVVSGNTQTLFGRFEDWAMAQAAAAEPVAKLDAQAQGQMAAAQAVIDTLKAQEEEAALRYDESKRVLGDNHNALMDSLQMQYEAQLAQIEATNAVGARFDSAVSAMTAASAAASGGSGSSAAGNAALIAAISQLSTQMGITYSQAESVMNGYTSPSQYVGTGNSTYGGIGTAPSGSAQDLINQAAYNAGNKFETTYNPNGGYDLNKTLQGYKELFPAGSFGSNYSVSGFQSYMNAVGYQGATTPEATELLKLWAAGVGLAQYAVGTPYVPEDGPAYLHKGEMVVPAAYNPNATGRTTSANADVVAELRTLNDRMSRIEAATTATAGFTAGTDRQLRRVIKSDAITTETVA